MEDYLRANKLVLAGELSSLQSLRIAFDASHFLRLMEKDVHRAEPLWDLHGFVPSTLFGRVDKELHQLAELGIQPVFVFSGLQAKPLQGRPVQVAPKPRDGKSWNDSNPTPIQHARPFTDDVEQALFHYLKKLDGVECVRAPYYQWPQMAYLAGSKDGSSVHGVCGPVQLLLFQGVKGVILEMNFARGTFSYAVRTQLLENLKRKASGNRNQQPDEISIIDAYLVTQGEPFVGTAFRERETTKFEQAATVDGRMSTYIQEHPNTNMQYQQRHEAKKLYRSRAIVRHSIVLAAEGAIPISKTSDPAAPGVPNNLIDLFGPPLPSLVYGLHLSGLISTPLLSTVVHRYIIDGQPPVDTKEHQLSLSRIIPLRTQMVFKLIRVLAERQEKLAMTTVVWNRWFNDKDTPVLKPPPINLEEWHVEKETNGANVANITLMSVQDYAHEAYKVQVGSKPPYNNLPQVFAATLLKSLDFLGYFTHASDELTQTEFSGRSIYSEALTCCTNPRHADLCVLFIELIRTSSLDAKEYNYVAPNPATLQPRPDQSPHVRFVSRCLSMLPATFSEPWRFRPNVDLMAFQVIAISLQKALRSVVEVVGAIHCMELHPTITLADAQTMADHLPFETLQTTAVGALFGYLMESDDNFDLGCMTPADRMTHLRQRFPAFADIKAELVSGFEFWSQIYNIMQKLTNDKSSENAAHLAGVVGDADRVLNQKRELLDL